MPTFNFPFTSRGMTREVRLHPKRYGLVSALNIFPLDTIDSTFAQVTQENGVLRVLAAKPRGGPAAKQDRKRQDTMIFQVPHFPIEDQILAKDLQDRRIVLDGQEVPVNLPRELAKAQERMARNHAITAEFVRMSALKGIIRDGDGTVLTNLYEDFGVDQHVVDFKLGTETSNIRELDEEVRGHIEDNLLGETVDTIEVLASPEFFGKLVDHPETRRLWEGEGKSELRQLPRYREAGITGRMFNPFGLVTYIEYRGAAPVAGGVERFIAANEGHAYPVGTTETASTLAAPADTLTDLNDLPSVLEMDFEDGAGRFALPIFMSAEILKHGKGVELWSESNFLPMWKQPKALVKVFTSN